MTSNSGRSRGLKAPQPAIWKLSLHARRSICLTPGPIHQPGLSLEAKIIGWVELSPLKEYAITTLRKAELVISSCAVEYDQPNYLQVLVELRSNHVAY